MKGVTFKELFAEPNRSLVGQHDFHPTDTRKPTPGNMSSAPQGCSTDLDRALSAKDPNESIQQTFSIELSHVHGWAAVSCGLVLFAVGVPMSLYGVSLLYGLCQIMVVFLLTKRLISSFCACQIILTAFLACVSWDVMATGGYASPFMVGYALFPYILLGKANLKWSKFWIVLAMLFSVVVSLISRIYPFPVLASPAHNALNIFLRLLQYVMSSVETAKFDSFRRQMITCLGAEKRAITQAAHAKSEFLAVMSHEIRTPLQGVIGWVDLLRSEPSLQHNSDTKNQLRYLSECSTNLKEVVSNILDYSKIQEGKFPAESVPFLIHELIDEVLQTTHAHKKVRLVTKLGTIPGVCYGPKLPMKQCLSNVVSNAIKFTPSGTVTISCNASQDTFDENGPPLQKQIKLIFEVQDTGIGISDEHQKQIFTAFQQADFSITRSYGGTGLGLAIIKSLSKLMGGDAWCVSKLGEGSSFFFSVIVDQSSEEELDKFRQYLENERLRYSSPKIRARLVRPVLVVDDNKMNQLFITTTLTKLGVPFVQAWNGYEAVEHFKRQALSLIVMDYHMPRMNGTEAATQIRKLIEYGGDVIPIVILTGDTDRILAHRKNKNLFSDCIEKPFTVQKLSTCVERWVPGVESSQHLKVSPRS